METQKFMQSASQTELLTDAKQIAALAETLKKEKVIAYDTEFIRETTFFPSLEIIQVATEKQTWLVDFQAFHRRHRGEVAAIREELQPLVDVLLDPKILKIVHAAQGDQECLHTGLGILAEPLLDTSIAAGLCGYGDGVGLGQLLRSLLRVKIKKGHARTNWSARPLPKQLMEYARLDVDHLVALGSRLLSDLEELGRKDWALELCAKYSRVETFETSPEEMALKLVKGGRLDGKGYSVLLELMRWRESRIRKIDIPRKRLADDGTLLDLARVCPKDESHLRTFRGLNKREARVQAKEILAAIRTGLKRELAPPEYQPRRSPTPDEARVISLLRCYVGYLADRHRIASRFLLSADQFTDLIRNPVQRPGDWVRQGILSQGAADLIGKELIAILSGKLGISIHLGKIQIVQL